MNCLVTGGAGFIGSNLVDALLARGDAVTVVDDLSTGRRENLDGGAGRGRRAGRGRHPRRARGRRAARRAAARGRLPPGRPDRRPQVGRRPRLRRLDQRRRHRQRARGGPRRPARGASSSSPPAARSTARARASSCRSPRTRRSRRCPPYGQSKFAAEGYLALYERLYGLSGVSLRLGNVYGPRQDPLGEAGVIAIFCGRLRAGERPTVFGDGRQTRDYIYVGDVVARGAGRGRLGGARRDQHRHRDRDRRPRAGRAPRRARRHRASSPSWPRRATGEVQRISIDPSRAERELGWRPRPSSADGLRLTLDSTLRRPPLSG